MHDVPETPKTSAPTQRNIVLRVEGLGVTFQSFGRPDFEALAGIDLQLFDREIVGIVGESGSGKTTLGRCIAGFLQPTIGTIRARGEGERPGSEKPRSIGRAGVQMVFQEASTSLNPRLPLWRSVAEALTKGRSTGRAHKSAAVAELVRVGLTPAQAIKLPSEVSGGQRQRAGIARALASGAEVLVCDEAVASLDVSVRSKVLNLLLDLRETRGTSILFISHDMGIVAHLADRLIVMKDGRIVEAGPTQQVIGDPRHDYTKALLAAVPSLERGLS